MNGLTNSTVVVVGAGAAGTLVAARLLDAANGRGRCLDVHLVDPRQSTGAGVAYSTRDDRHLLNVPVRGMSAYADDVEHFQRWLELDTGCPVEPDTFVPRGVYARYLAAVVDASAARCRSGQLHRTHRRAVGVRRAGRTGCVVMLDDATEIAADACILATGHVDTNASWAPPALRDSARLVTDPWAEGALDCVPPDDDVLLVGAGLTTADLANTLARPGRVVHVTSRTGLLPHVHARGLLPRMEAPELPPRATLGELRDAMRNHVVKAKERYGDWRPAVDSIRALTQTVWRGLDDADKAEFLRSDLREWERARHRLSPATAERLTAHRRAGRVSLHCGAVTDAAAMEGGRVRVTLADGTGVDVAAVVNCTGPGVSPVDSRDPLMQTLLTRGLARPGPVGLGVDTRPDGRVVAEDGEADGLLWAIGPLRRGTLWETTAIPEIRVQAAALADEIVGTAATSRSRPVDRYGLGLSTGADAADAFTAAQDALLLMHDGALEHLEAATDADPGFAIAHATLALLGHEWDLDVDVPRRLEAARNAAARRADDRERSLVRAIEARLCGLTDADRVLCNHVRRHPRDAVAVGLALPTIAFGGLAQPAEESWGLADWLAPSYGDDWWFTGVLAFFRQEQSRWVEAEQLAERSLALQQGSGHAAHARAHVCYETGEHASGMQWLDSWIDECAATSRYRGHFAWHAVLHALALDDATDVRRRWLDTLAPHAVTGGRALVDSASMLWRAQINDCWPEADRVDSHLPAVLATVPECLLERPATAFAAMHAAIAHTARGDVDSLRALASHARGRCEPAFTEVVAPLCDGLSSYTTGDMTTAVSVLRRVLPDTARLGGSAAQREVVEDTFLRALLDAGQIDEAADVLQRRLDRRPHPNDARRLAAIAQ